MDSGVQIIYLPFRRKIQIFLSTFKERPKHQPCRHFKKFSDTLAIDELELPTAGYKIDWEPSSSDFTYQGVGVNKFFRQQDLELARLTSAPAHPVLIQMLSMAQKNSGKTISVSWKTFPSPDAYFLEIIFSDDTKEFVGRRAAANDSREPRWTLSTENEAVKLPDSKRTEVWSHVSGDVGLIQNLIWSETTGTNQETAESMFLITNAGNLSHRAERLPVTQYSSNQQNATSQAITQPSPLVQTPSAQAAQTVPQNVTLVGELAEIDLSGIFQSIMICKMTGRLDIQDRLNQAEIFFDDGSVVHASVQNALTDSTRTILGDQALLTVLTWDEGSFLFQKDRRTSERSVKRRLEGLLLEGASLRDYHKYLRNLGVSEDSVLHKRCAELTEEQVNERLSTGVPIDAAIQKKIYYAIDGKKSLISVIDLLNISKTLWTPIVFNLFSCELISGDRDAKDSEVAEEAAPPIDPSMVLQASRSLARPETGLYPFPLCVFFMEQEVARVHRAQSLFTVAVFELKNKKDALSNKALQQVAECFDTLKEKFDIIGHYKVFEFIMLLPLRPDEDCKIFATSFVNALRKTNLDGIAAPEDLVASFGIATAPSDKENLTALLTAAEQAKHEASTKGALFVTARDFRFDKHTQHAQKAITAKNFLEAETALVAACNEAESFPVGDVRLMQTVEELAKLQLRQDKYASADTLLELLLSLKEQAHGTNSVEFAMCASELARCYYLQGKYPKAEPLLHDVIQVYGKVFGQEHLATANALYNLGTLLQVQNRLPEVKPIYKAVLAIRTNLLGLDHPDTKKVGSQYDELLRIEEGAELFTTGSFKTYLAEGELQ